jgi:CubicO group peptidase (beta-lactamase class C family)
MNDTKDGTRSTSTRVAPPWPRTPGAAADGRGRALAAAWRKASRWWPAVCLVAFLTAHASAQVPLTATASSQVTGSHADPIAGRLETYTDGIVDAHMREHLIPGVTVGVVKDGRVLFVKGYGLAKVAEQQEASGRDTRFRIASISKTFIWTAVMMLVDRGELDLDTDVNTYLEGFELPRTFDEPVTLNHLMAHRAGFESTLAVFLYSNTSEMTLTEALHRDRPEIVHEPGTRTSYSNYGSSLAAKIVADVSGMTYVDFLEKELLAPLGMTRTSIRPVQEWSEEQRASLAVGYDIVAGSPVPADEDVVRPHAPVGAIAATAEDMTRWMLFHLGRGQLDGTRLMSEEAHAQLWTRAFDDRAAGADLAHGFMSTNYGGFETFGHGGSLSGFYSNLVMVPDLDVGVFVSVNSGVDRGLVLQLPFLLIRQLLPEGADFGEISNGTEAEQRAAECVGEYRDNRRSFTKFEKSEAVEWVTRVAAAGDGRLAVTAQGDSTVYSPLAASVDTYQDDFGGRIVFGRDASGAVTHYSGPYGVHSYERVTALDSAELLELTSMLAVLFSFTTWLGLLWRRGVPSDQTMIGKLLVLASVVASITVAVVVVAFLGVQNATLSPTDYPSAQLVFMRSAMTVLFAIGIAGLISLWPAWRSSGWGFVRKLHYSLYALSLGGLAFLYQHWNLVLAPFSG